MLLLFACNTIRFSCVKTQMYSKIGNMRISECTMSQLIWARGENLTKMKPQFFHKIYEPAHEIWVPFAYVQEHPFNTHANLSATSHINCIVAPCLINVYLRSWWCCTFWMTSLMTLNQHKSENYVIIASLKNEIIGKLYRIPGSRLLISNLLGSALRMLVDTARPGKLDIKRH